MRLGSYPGNLITPHSTFKCLPLTATSAYRWTVRHCALNVSLNGDLLSIFNREMRALFSVCVDMPVKVLVFSFASLLLTSRVSVTLFYASWRASFESPLLIALRASCQGARSLKLSSDNEPYCRCVKVRSWPSFLIMSDLTTVKPHMCVLGILRFLRKNCRMMETICLMIKRFELIYCSWLQAIVKIMR